MKHIDSFKIFESRKKNSLRFFDTYSDSDYNKYTGTNATSGWKTWLYDMFKNLEGRFDNFNSYYLNNMAVKDSSGRAIDTGLGWLIGTAGSMVSHVSSKIFEPSEIGSIIKKDGENKSGIGADETIRAQHQRLLNDTFIKEDLPKIKSDSDFQNYFFDYYRGAGTKPGENKQLDRGIATLTNTYLNSKRGVLPRITK